MLPYQHPVTCQLSTAQRVDDHPRGCAFPLECLLPQPKTTHKHFINNKWYNHIDTSRAGGGAPSSTPVCRCMQPRNRARCACTRSYARGWMMPIMGACSILLWTEREFRVLGP